MKRDSLVFLIPSEAKSECGYCKVNNVRVGESVSYGFISDYMNISDYEKLMLVGWRRSGNYFYKPTMHKTCCPAYTIRLNNNRFVESKSHRKVRKKFNRYLETGTLRDHSESTTPLQQSLPLQFSITTLKPAFSSEKFELYKKYQVNVHHDDPSKVTEEGLTRFLINSPLHDDISTPLNPLMTSETTEVLGYGSYHQEYRIGGTLVAVGVIDIIPTGLSSVYLFYDPDLSSLVLGKFTALKEIEFCHTYGLQYYYMGYYIHSCVKMRYKAEFSPSELLCPTTLNWYEFSDSVKHIERHKFTPLEPNLAQERMELGEEPSDLEKYSPIYESPPSNYPGEIRIAIEENQPLLKVKQLRKEGQDFMKELLRGFIDRCGYLILTALVIALYIPQNSD